MMPRAGGAGEICLKEREKLGAESGGNLLRGASKLAKRVRERSLMQGARIRAVTQDRCNFCE